MSNIKTALEGTDLVASIRIESRHPSGRERVWIIVEGETDRRLFRKLIDGAHVEIETSPSGLRGVLDIVATLLREMDRIIGIRDADFLHPEGKEESAGNIFVTDCHDAEMMILSRDNAYHQVAWEYLEEGKHASFSRERILASIAFIGALRWMNHTDDLKLDFDGLGLGAFYDRETLVLDETGFLEVVMKRSGNKRKAVSREEVESKVEDASDLPNPCNGHDFQKVFALLADSNAKKGVSPDEIGRAFRMAYRPRDFRTTDLYGKLIHWSDKQSRPLFSARD
uniref:Uncharacterized protein n=1 Tax=Candidatus Kentrum eta TaxID=2126337 RepID=A0A450VED5_9GAMM|nr:MAG: Protein of unknown function (DUF4435) [Candidatus Kentron sp. H]VFK03145.1 MAG: Protein of unknown function (DUF4435) [Candidatus Kentron sp. H]VFK05852.1 MAG: Protein of unknown function (DUF4435) [Candidatus Kentron sp. H]